MNYELAKQLEDAGFPEWFNSHLPNLSMLIFECGERFIQFTRTNDGEWIAAGLINKNQINTDKALGGEFEKTPEEAVALLYIALNKNK